MFDLMERLLIRGKNKAKAKLLPVPVEYEADEPMLAWSKIDRTIDTAQTDVHIEAAQRMFNKMLTYYGFTNAQRHSPLIYGMQEKINTKRATVVITQK